MSPLIIFAVLAVLALWCLAAAGLALLTGGLIHQREVHDDRPLEAASVVPADGRLPDEVVRTRVA